MTTPFTHETLPTDPKAAIRQMKQALRAQIGDVQAVFDRLSATIAARVAEINDLKAQGQPVWPIIPFSELAMGNISDATRAEVKRRGCAVIKGHFPREQALAWDQSMLDYLDKNHFDEVYKGPGDNFFGTLSASRPEIYPVYWSQAQMQARQSEEMALAQSFLNRLWQVERDGKQWFNPDISIIYPDRIRRRPPGTTSKGWERIPTPARWSAGCCQPISRYSPACLTATSSSTIRGMRRTVLKLKSIRWITPQNARYFAPSRAGPHSPICCPVRDCFMSSLSRKRWRIFCCARYWMMSRKMNYAASRRAGCYRFLNNGILY